MKRSLFHWPLDPGSREARLALGEKKLSFTPYRLDLPADTKTLQGLNPSGRTPVLREEDESGTRTICETRAILEYLEETQNQNPLLPKDPVERAEVRRLLSWFSEKFQTEVLGLILYERVEKPLLGLGAPDGSIMREGKANLRGHLAYIEQLIEQRNWLGGTELSLADLSAMASLSCLDYFGDIPFEKFPLLTSWYVRLKSRPSYRPLLHDTFPGIAPAPHYADLDF